MYIQKLEVKFTLIIFALNVNGTRKVVNYNRGAIL